MENRYLYSRHPFAQLVLIAGVTIISFIVLMVLAIMVGMLFLRMPLESWLSISIDNPESLPILKYMQITQSIGLFVAPPLIIGWLMLRSPSRYLSLDKTLSIKSLLLVIGILIAAIPMNNLLMLWNQELRLPNFLAGVEAWMQRAEENAAQVTTAFLTVSSFGGFLVNVLMVAIIPAVGEEFFFRGMIQKTLHRWFKNPHWAILVTAIIFSAFHLQFYGFIPRMVLGLLFGYLLYWSGNLWYPIIGHLINNLIPVVLTFFFPEQFNPADLDQVSAGNGLWLWGVAGTLAVVSGCVYFFRLQSIRQL